LSVLRYSSHFFADKACLACSFFRALASRDNFCKPRFDGVIERDIGFLSELNLIYEFASKFELVFFRLGFRRADREPSENTMAP
jgi:hypothetical protein